MTTPTPSSSSLLWPDSEDLLQNILAVDPALWQQPLALAPSTLESVDLSHRQTETDNTSPGFPDDSSTIADDGKQAIQSLSSLINDTVCRSFAGPLLLLHI